MWKPKLKEIFGDWRWWKALAWGAGALLVALSVTAWILARQAEPFLRARVVEALEQRLHARVELDEFHLSLVRGFEARGGGLRIWPQTVNAEAGALPVESKPLVSLVAFQFSAPWRFKPGKPIHIARVELRGLSVDLPPRSHFLHSAKSPAPANHAFRFELDAVECDGVRLVLETDKPGRRPLDFELATLRITGLADASAHFEAALKIPRPEGRLSTAGTFTPTAGDPGESPITGDFTLSQANLDRFKGIAGDLNATGHYKGTLRDLNVEGQTSTTNFRLTHFNQAARLETHFAAQVDAANGDTVLNRVDATLGHSRIVATGAIARVPGPFVDGRQLPGGHDINLNLQVDRGRVEDLLRLVSKSGNVLMTGLLTMKTSLHLPPGPAKVHERMQLNGSLSVEQTVFASQKIQGKVAELSLRGQGQPEAVKTTNPDSIHSALAGLFVLAAGTVRLARIDFSTPGVRIDLAGTYRLDDGALDFSGKARLDAPVSKMVGGWRGALLKPTDRIFRHEGAGLELPIQIGGTREQPVVSAELGPLKLSHRR